MCAEKPHVCPPSRLWQFDNFVRALLHPPGKVFGPYVKPGMHVLDVGCGGGFTTVALARLIGPGGRLVAADVQREMLDRVHARARRHGLDQCLELHLCDAGSIGAAGPFHFANAFWMAHETPDQAAFLGEIHGLLHDGGLLLVAEPMGHVKKPGFAKTLDLARAAGFTVHARPKIFMSHAAVLEK